ncbi:MAG: hypothetical protein JW757_12545 [Anaerolineales bacterium]|nr:hypothetical protein [Anaerolineales bacterium]
MLLALMAGAAGCAPASPEAAPTEVNLLETMVAEAVETQREAGQEESANLDATLTMAAEQPAVLAAQTLTPTITPTATPTATPAPVLPTLPPLPTRTLAPPSAPDRNPDDPALRLGDPDWVDSFDSSVNWTTFTGTNSQVEITDGVLRYTVFEATPAPTWTTSWPQVSNFYMEVQAQMPAACRGKDRLGLIFRAPDPSSGYRFEISCDGQYRLLVFGPEGAEVAVAWASSEYLLAGPNQINRLGVWAQGKVIALHINGAAVAGLEQNDYRSGTFGFSVTAEETDYFTAVFDDLMYWTFE